MKLTTFRTLPKEVGIAFSGGVDSVVMFHLARSLNRKITLFTFDHLTETSKFELDFAREFASKHNVELIIGTQSKEVPTGESKEKYWSKCRNNWFNSFDTLIATGHHLNDAAEWYLMSAFTGAKGGFLLDYQCKNVIRPLILIKKSDILDHAALNHLEYIEDPTNGDVSFNLRNKVRLNLLPEVLKTFPGFLKTIKTKIVARENLK